MSDQPGRGLSRSTRWHDPTHGRIDRDIQEQVEAMNPCSLGSRVAMENTLQEQRNRTSTSLDDLIAEYRAEHPWLWRRTQARTRWQAFVGRFLPWLCRHNGTTGPAGGDRGVCLFCGREVAWDD